MSEKIISQEIECNLSVKLTDDEIVYKAKELGEVLVEKRNMEAALKSYNKTKKEDIAGLESEVRVLSGAINSGTENRMVECVRFVDIEKSKIWFEYEDEIYDERTLSADELNRYRQRDIDESKDHPEDEQAETHSDSDGEKQESETENAA